MLRSFRLPVSYVSLIYDKMAAIPRARIELNRQLLNLPGPGLRFDVIADRQLLYTHA